MCVLFHNSSDRIGSMGDRPDATPSWREGATYLQRGLAITRMGLGVQLLILAVYASPALAAAFLTTLPQPSLWQQALRQSLPWVTAILGTVVVMAAVARQSHDRPVGLCGATRLALPWVPRYAWTNVHTSVVFWVPVGLLLQVRGWQEALVPLAGWAGSAAAGLWWLVIGGVAVTMHTRTLLAPFLAIHGDRPGTLAALEAWRLSGRYFAVCLGTLVLAGAPVALPLATITLVLVLTLPIPAVATLEAAAPDLIWAAIQAVRLVLIPALYLLYHDLWQAELAHRERYGQPPVPRLAQALLALTRPLPHFGQAL